MDVADQAVQIIIKHLLPIMDKDVTVFFSGASIDLASQMDAINGMLLREANIVVTDNCKNILLQGGSAGTVHKLISDYPRMQKTVRKSHLVLVPALTRNTLAKVATGIQDNLVTNGLAIALMSGVPVIAVNDHYHPQGRRAKELGFDRNPAYAAMLLKHEKLLESFGVKIVDGAEFSCAIKETLYPAIFRREPRQRPSSRQGETGEMSAQKLITYQDISGLAYGSALALSKNAIITPLAKEFISHRNIDIRFI